MNSATVTFTEIPATDPLEHPWVRVEIVASSDEYAMRLMNAIKGNKRVRLLPSDQFGTMRFEMPEKVKEI